MLKIKATVAVQHTLLLHAALRSKTN